MGLTPEEDELEAHTAQSLSNGNARNTFLKMYIQLSWSLLVLLL